MGDHGMTEPRWIEGGIPGGGTSGDRHLLILDRDRRMLYELYALQWNVAAQRWEAGSGAVFPLDTNLRRPEGWTSADAAGSAASATTAGAAGVHSAVARTGRSGTSRAATSRARRIPRD